MGGRVDNFKVDDEFHRSQHYAWLIPIYYRSPDQSNNDVGCMYLQARTTTVKRSLVPNSEDLEFGEVPVAYK